uniref:Uncharacterized protein n=1 Tax=Vespula pensylvanica TaxID=30213 RepID=A0A834JRW7_VESPE|nr:hypothetical protein H0235_017470 [Vespula pensylvanica]
MIVKDKSTISDTTWITKTSKIKATSSLLIKNVYLIHIRNAMSAKEDWVALQEYHQKSFLPKTNNQLEALGELKKSRLKEILKSFVAMILSSLPELYNNLINGFGSRPEKDVAFSLKINS